MSLKFTVFINQMPNLYLHIFGQDNLQPPKELFSISIENLTDFTRLINCYKESKCRSVGDFMNKGLHSRLNLPGYGRMCEATLRESVKLFLQESEYCNGEAERQETNNKSNFADEQVLCKILDGIIIPSIFYTIDLKDITINNRLLRQYFGLGCKSAADFLRLGSEFRLALRSYGKGCELDLANAVDRILKKNIQTSRDFGS